MAHVRLFRNLKWYLHTHGIIFHTWSNCGLGTDKETFKHRTTVCFD